MTTEQAEIKGEVVRPSKADLLKDPMSGARSLGMTEDESAFIYSGKDGADLDADDPYRRILEQILSAETPDAVLTPIEAHKIAEYAGVPLLLFGHELQKSEYEVGSPFYAAMQCRDPVADEPIIITSGHRKVMAQLVKLKQFGEYPYQVMARARGTGAGGDPLYELVKWPEDFDPDSQAVKPPF